MLYDDDAGLSSTDCFASNLELLRKLRPDDHEEALHQLALDDFALGRMSKPVRTNQVDLHKVRLVPRFGVVQGVKPDGSAKVRAVDHMSWSMKGNARKRSRKDMKADSVNGHYVPKASVTHDHLDDLRAAMRLHVDTFHEQPWLFKADIDSAFRRVPVQESHKWATGVAYLVKDQPMIAFHHGMPFGATSSVIAWHRIGELLTALARKLLKIPIFRYVDDYFAAERKETAKHAMDDFATLVRLLLGESAISARKLEVAHELLLLGIKVKPEQWGASFTLDRDRAEKWIAIIDLALKCGILTSGEASKMAGRLMWATQSLFHKLGRAMIKAFFAQCSSKDGKIGLRLRIALLWWKHVLRCGVCETHNWDLHDKKPCHIFVDAASSPARCAAVLHDEGLFFYSDAPPTNAMLRQMGNRGDKQIMSLEMMAILFALTTFRTKLANRRVILFSDNTGAEKSAVKGSAQASDHNEIVHEIWTYAFEHGIKLWIERVPSEDNISDCPSRQEYELMTALGATWCEPVFTNW